MKVYLAYQIGPVIRAGLLALAATVTTLAQTPQLTIPADWPKAWQEQAQQMDLAAVKTGVLLNKAALTDRQLAFFRKGIKSTDGTTINVATESVWKDLYDQLRRADLRQKRLKERPLFPKSDAESMASRTTIPIGILNIEGELLTSAQLADNIEAKKRGQKADGSKYERINFKAASVLQEVVYTGQVALQFDPATYLTNLPGSVSEVGVDFLDEKGFQMVRLAAPEAILHQYTSPGRKTILIKVISSEGTYISASHIDVKTATPYRLDASYEVQAERVKVDAMDKNRSGRSSWITGGSLRVVLGCDGVLDKPVLVVEGFDPGNQRGFNQLINNYLGWFNGTQYFGTFGALTSSGYDIVFLNFNDARDFIQNNAAVVRAAIRKINEVKAGNQKMVVVGESAGGVSSRYALKKQEQEGYDPRVSHFISFDAPQRGANVPVGLQSTIRNAANNGLAQLANCLRISPDIQALFDLNNDGNQPAARQLIMERCDAGGIPYVHPDYTSLQTELQQLGYPSLSRNITLACGSLNGTGQRTTFGTPEMQGQRMLTQGNFGYDALVNTHVNNQTTEVAFLRIALNTYSLRINKPVNRDISPGGLDDNLATQDPNIGFQFNFIPTYSAIDSPNSINNDGDLYQTRINSPTPFARVYGEDENNRHVEPIDVFREWQSVFRNELGVNPDNLSCQQPENMAPPTPYFNSPISLCGETTLIGDVSGGVGGLGFVYDWKLQPIVTSIGPPIRTGTGDRFFLNSRDYAPGTYMVTCSVRYAAHTYQSSSTCIVFIPANCGRSARVGTEEPLAGLQISPNPVSEHLRVNLPVEATEGATLHLVDSRGSVLLRQKVTGGGPHGLDVGSLAPGLYLLRAHTDTQQWVGKVIINR